MSEQPNPLESASDFEAKKDIRAQSGPKAELQTEPTREELSEIMGRLTTAVESLTEVIRNLHFEKLGQLVYLSHVEAIDPERVQVAKGEQIARASADFNMHAVDAATNGG